MELIHAIILGIVEGLTEFIPVSSTGHLILASHLLKLPQTDFLKTFEIAIQLGAILAVVALYWRSLFVNFEIMKRVAVAFLPTAALGFVFYKLIKQYLLGSASVVIWALFIGGVLLIVFERFHREKDSADGELSKLSYAKCLAIGLFQCLAMIPGVSRSGATILGGLTLGLKRETIVEFSFLLAVPTMFAATALDILKNEGSFSAGELPFLLVGAVTAFFVAMASIQFLLGFIRRRSFTVFGVYRILVALMFWFMI